MKILWNSTSNIWPERLRESLKWSPNMPAKVQILSNLLLVVFLDGIFQHCNKFCCMAIHWFRISPFFRVTGYVAMKIGKTVATAVGGSLILLQLAHHKGYISVNWSKVNKDLEGASNKLAKSGNDPAMPKFLNKVTARSFQMKNVQRMFPVSFFFHCTS